MFHRLRTYLFLFFYLLISSISFGQSSKLVLAKGELMDSIYLNNLNNQTPISSLENFLTHQYQKDKDKEYLAFIKFMKLWYKADKTSPDFNALNEIIKKEFSAYPNIQARYFNQIAYMNFIGFHNYERAFDAYMQLEDILVQHGPQVISRYSQYCSQIASAFYRFKDYKKAIYFGKMGLQYANEKWDMYNTIGLCFTALNQLDSSNYYLNQAVLEAKRRQLPIINQSISSGNIGYNHYLRGQYELAFPLLNFDFQEAVKYQDWGLAAGSAIPMSHIYISQKKFKAADSLLKLSRQYIQKSGQIGRLEQYFSKKSIFYESSGDLKKSIAYRDSALKAYKYNDSVYNGLLVLRVKQRADLTKIESEKLKLHNYQEVVRVQFIAIGIIVLILGIGYYLYRNYLHRLQTNRERIAELKRIISLRQRISADMHDDIGSSLSSIALYSHSLLLQAQNAEQQYVLTKIKENAVYIQEQFNDIIWSVNPKMDVMKELVVRMRKFGAEITESADIVFVFNCDEAILDLEIEMNWRRNLFLMYKEIIHNAIKYSKAKEISVELTFHESQFKVQISDNGIGFDINQCKQGNGLINLHLRAKHMGAELRVESKLNEGTYYSIISPIV